MKSPLRGWGVRMNDWRKTTYRITPPPDHLAEAEDFKYGVGGWLLILTMLGIAAAALLWLLGLLL